MKLPVRWAVPFSTFMALPWFVGGCGSADGQDDGAPGAPGGANSAAGGNVIGSGGVGGGGGGAAASAEAGSAGTAQGTGGGGTVTDAGAAGGGPSGALCVADELHAVGTLPGLSFDAEDVWVSFRTASPQLGWTLNAQLYQTSNGVF